MSSSKNQRRILVIGNRSQLPPDVQAGLIKPTRVHGTLKMELANKSQVILCLTQQMQSYLKKRYARDAKMKTDSQFSGCLVFVLNSTGEVMDTFSVQSQPMQHGGHKSVRRKHGKGHIDVSIGSDAAAMA